MLSQYVALDESGVVKIPATLTYEEAATLPCAGVTAWNGLFNRGAMQPGDYVLLEGTGGVSLLGLSLAVADGAKPIITSSHDEKLVRAKDGPVVGLHLVGARVGELIGEAQLIFNWEAYSEDVAALVHAHPTQNEALGEAHLALAGKPLHSHS